MNDFDRISDGEDSNDQIAAALQSQRPELTALELDRVRSEVHRRTASGRMQSRGSLLKSRLAAVLIVTMGVLTSGSGVALGVDAISSGGSAARDEYGPSTQCQASDSNCQGVLGQSGGGKNGGSGGNASNGGSAGSPPGNIDASGQAATATASKGSLPFTGFLAIPILLVGVVLTISGLVLRRRLGSDQAA